MSSIRSPHPPGSAAHFAEGHLAQDYVEPGTGLRALVLRGTFSWCGYVGAPCTSPLHGLEELDFDCHYGITYTGYGDGLLRPKGYYYWGWDYSHFEDAFLPVPRMREHMAGMKLPRGKDWTHAEVLEDVLDVMANLRDALLRNEELAREVFHGTAR